MPQRWRLLLAGVLALVALAIGAALALFPVPDRLGRPLGLVLLLAIIFVGWNLYRWFTMPEPLLRPALVQAERRPTPLWRQLPWFCLQLAAIGVCAWLWASDPSPDRPPFGLALLLGAALAIALTAVPFILKDMIVGRWRLWSDRRRARKGQRTATNAASTLRPQPQETAVTSPTPLRRDQERPAGQIDPDLASKEAPGDRTPNEDLNERQEKLIDEAVEETFPASDPIAPKRITR